MNNSCRDPYPLKLDRLQDYHPEAKYIGQFPTKTNMGWGYPASIFYQPNPDVSKGHKHYFGLFIDLDKNAIVFDASYIEDERIAVGVADSGEIVWSTYRHDYVNSEDGTINLDGGFDYVKTSTPERIQRLTIKELQELVWKSDH